MAGNAARLLVASSLRSDLDKTCSALYIRTWGQGPRRHRRQGDLQMGAETLGHLRHLFAETVQNGGKKGLEDHFCTPLFAELGRRPPVAPVLHSFAEQLAGGEAEKPTYILQP